MHVPSLHLAAFEGIKHQGEGKRTGEWCLSFRGGPGPHRNNERTESLCSLFLSPLVIADYSLMLAHSAMT